MKKINRSTFIKQSLKAGAIVAINPLPGLFLPTEKPTQYTLDEALLQRLVTANDAQAEALLKQDIESKPFSRKTGADLEVLAASYCSPSSRFYQSGQVAAVLQTISLQLLKAQAEDGTANFGNLESPPDTAFLVELVAAAATPLRREKAAALVSVNNNIRQFLVKAGNALVTGGVHTPNHRWVISAALARLNALFPSKTYVERIDDWLGEGVYINSDGNYP
ncbi:MAG TPA: hypothetical protein VFL47_13350, partial [Flavisolibacter sp.]|nr:hypothetical protein [Flavisolibacter sp.]